MRKIDSLYQKCIFVSKVKDTKKSNEESREKIARRGKGSARALDVESDPLITLLHICLYLPKSQFVVK